MSMQNSQGGIPVVILKDGAQQTKGRDAQKNNITAAKLIAEIIHTSLGPRGMDKMLVDSLGDVTITNDGETILKEIDDKIARTAMQTKLVRKDSNNLADIVVKAILAVAEKTEAGYAVDIDDIKVEKKAGGSIKDPYLTKGIVLDKEVVHSGMPKKIANAKIALVNSALEIDKTEFDAKINISNPQQMKSFLDEENKMIKNMVDKVVASGANVLLCQKGIDDIAQHYLAKAGILTVRRVKESDLSKLAKATGARMVTNLDDLFEKDLGAAENVEERKVETDRWVFVEGCKHPKAVTILVRGGSQRVVDEVER